MSLTIGIDIGGTFTDTVVMDGDGAVAMYKSPTTPSALIEGVLANLDLAATEADVDRDTLLSRVDRIAHGTTVATNAYIERRGAQVALLTTRGFEDTIFMQRMMGMTSGLGSSELTDYSRRRVPEPLCPRSLVFGIRERVDYRGDVIGPLQDDDVRSAAQQIAASGVDAVAISFLWSFKNPAHEQRAAALLRELLPDVYVTASNELVPRLGEYERTATTLVNAYLGPLVERYTATLEERLESTPIFLLDSTGGVVTPTEAGRAPVRLLLSGPSGGVTASQNLGATLGHPNIITFDMGGTSTDIGLIVDGEPLRRHETEAGGYHLLLPLVDVNAIGTGGGSIASVEAGGYLQVGPESAGASPGPACYGRGGERPTVTDADLVLGILDPDNFLGGRIRLDVEAARSAIRNAVADPLGMSVEEAAAGIKRIADTRMADLLRTVTIERGYDARDFVLYAFGGAGATHAPAFALDMVDTVLVPASQSVHSAFGAVASDVSLVVETASPRRVTRSGDIGDDVTAEVEQAFERLERRATDTLAAQGVSPERRELRRIVEIRFARQSKALAIPYEGSVERLLAAFLEAYGGRYGHEAVPETADFELATYVIQARGRLERPQLAVFEDIDSDPAEAGRGHRPVFDPTLGEIVQMPVYDGASLRAGHHLPGPAIIEYPGTTVALVSGQVGRVDRYLNIEIRRSA
jgi:N-methylhydantoinase A